MKRPAISECQRLRADHSTVISFHPPKTLSHAAMKNFLPSSLLALAALTLAAGPAAAERQPVLIELFASQNCNACPAAHRTLKAVQAEQGDNVMVLTWSVDYWDYLGTPDPMALPVASERQAAYADRLGVRAPYTPQSVYDGAKQCPATRRAAVDENIALRTAADRPGEVSVAVLPGNRFSLDGHTPAPAEVNLVEFLDAPANPTPMVHPVTRASTLGLWTGGHVSFSYDCEASCVAIVQAPNYGEVYATHRLK